MCKPNNPPSSNDDRMPTEEDKAGWDAPTDPYLEVPSDLAQQNRPPAEWNLVAGYRVLIPGIDVPAHLVIKRGARCDRPGDYGLVPLSLEGRVQSQRTLNASGVAWPEMPVKITQGDYPGGVYIDTTIALGLTVADDVPEGKRLIAVAGIGVNDDNQLVVVQLQSVTGTRERDGEVHRQSGLYAGFMWRHTMLGLCETLGREIGASAVIVRSHVHSIWPLIQEHGWGQYDRVARECHYDRDAVTGDWVKLLP